MVFDLLQKMWQTCVKQLNVLNLFPHWTPPPAGIVTGLDILETSRFEVIAFAAATSSQSDPIVLGFLEPPIKL